MEGKIWLEFCDEKELCVANTWFRKGEKRKVTEIDLVLVGKENTSILCVLQHRLLVTDLVKKKVKVVRKKAIERRKLWKLKTIQGQDLKEE